MVHPMGNYLIQKTLRQANKRQRLNMLKAVQAASVRAIAPPARYLGSPPDLILCRADWPEHGRHCQEPVRHEGSSRVRGVRRL